MLSAISATVSLVLLTKSFSFFTEELLCASARICPPSSGQNFVPSVYSFPHFTQRGISLSGDTNFEPSSLQNFVPVGKTFPHFGQVGVSINSFSRLQPQFWQNFVPNSNSALHFGHLYIFIFICHSRFFFCLMYALPQYGIQSSHAGEFHPCVLTEPNVKVSLHSALHVNKSLKINPLFVYV